MIVPSLDLQDGKAVQLVEGREKALDAGDPEAVAERLAVAGELAVIDLDAALGAGSNRTLIARLVRRFPCRVGGGIRNLESARFWLEAGARRIILGTAATPELLTKLPRARVMAALDARAGEVVVEGWRRHTGMALLERIRELRPYVGGFLVTFVEREGHMRGTDLALARKVVEAAAGVPVTIAGGITTAEEIRALDALGADAQVGMALYTGRLHLADAIAAPLRSDREDGLWPTVVVDEGGAVLGLVYSNRESLRAAVDERRGVYWSRSRRALWRKGESSGAVQELLRIDLDCDRDALRFTVRQQPPGFCHLGRWSCFGERFDLAALERLILSRKDSAPSGSYTRRLLEDPELLAAKLREEADELARAGGREEVVWEAADLLYHLLVRLAAEGVTLAEVTRELERRSESPPRRAEGD